MYESDKPYAQANHAMMRGVGAMPQSAAVETPRLVQQLNHLERAVEGCHAIVCNLEQVADRLLGPAGPSSDKSSPLTQVACLETKIAANAKRIEELANRLGILSQRLNSAV